MTQFLPITTVTEIHTFILGSEFKYGAQVTIHVLGFTNSTGILLKCDAYTCHKYETTGKTNTTLPQIWWYSVLELKLKSRWKEIWNQAETNPIQCFPKFDGLSQPPSSFEDVFRHFVMNLSDFLWLYSHFSVRGRAHQGYRFGARQVTLFSLYFFRITSQGVAALVSVSDGKIKIYN